MSNFNPVNYQTFYNQRAASANNGQGAPQDVSIQKCIRREIQDLFVVRPLEKPVKVSPPDDSEYWSALGYNA
ncbi:MAG TPA: hypothetical protein V6C99_04250 [Oculatellaceae cyanobacterium]|jgi:hypothetical protein